MTSEIVPGLSIWRILLATSLRPRRRLAGRPLERWMVAEAFATRSRVGRADRTLLITKGPAESTRRSLFFLLYRQAPFTPISMV